MADTTQFALPLLAAAQAQKHVTVNEALARLDAVAQMRVETDDAATPPAAPLEGEAHVVGAQPAGDWAGQARKLAVFANGGWVFLAPKAGWQAWCVALGGRIVFDGTDWVRHAVTVSGGGAATLQQVVELDHVLGAGAVSVTAPVIPAKAQVLGVSARVIVPLSGTGVASWSLGVAGAPDRYGSGMGLGLNALATGLSGTPVTYWADTPLEITADAGSFSAGTIRLAVHFTTILPPRAV